MSMVREGISYFSKYAQTPVSEARRWLDGKKSTRIDVASGISGDPKKMLLVPGFTSTEAHLKPLAEAVSRILPDGSTVYVYRPRTRANVGVLDRGRAGNVGKLFNTIDPKGYADFRKGEEGHLDNAIQEITDGGNQLDAVIGWSLGGVLGLGAVPRLRDPKRVGGVYTLGAPHGVKGIGDPDIDIQSFNPEGFLHTMVAKRDKAVSQLSARHPWETDTDSVEGGHWGLVLGKGVPGVVAAVAERFLSNDPRSNAA